LTFVFDSGRFTILAPSTHDFTNPTIRPFWASWLPGLACRRWPSTRDTLMKHGAAIRRSWPSSFRTRVPQLNQTPSVRLSLPPTESITSPFVLSGHSSNGFWHPSGSGVAAKLLLHLDNEVFAIEDAPPGVTQTNHFGHSGQTKSPDSRSSTSNRFGSFGHDIRIASRRCLRLVTVASSVPQK